MSKEENYGLFPGGYQRTDNQQVGELEEMVRSMCQNILNKNTMSTQKTRILIEETEENGITLEVEGNALNLTLVLASVMNASPKFLGMIQAALLARQFSADEEE